MCEHAPAWPEDTAAELDALIQTWHAEETVPSRPADPRPILRDPPAGWTGM